MNRMVAAGLLTIFAQVAMACVDPVLKTNTDPQVLVRRCREVATKVAKGIAASESIAGSQGIPCLPLSETWVVYSWFSRSPLLASAIRLAEDKEGRRLEQ